MRNTFIYVIIAALMVLASLFSCTPQPSRLQMPEIGRVEAMPANNGCTLTITFAERLSGEYEIGFYYGLSEDEMSKVAAEQDSPASFTSILTALEYDTEYVYKAFISNGYNEVCSDTGRFRTLAEEQSDNSLILPYHIKEVGRLSSKFSFEVGGKADFSVIVPEEVDWLRCGVNDRTCIFFVETNDTQYPRSCDVIFRNLSDDSSGTLAVYQHAADASETNLPHNDVVLPPVEVHTWMTLLIDLDINVTPLDDASAQAQWLGCGSITNTPWGYSEVCFRAEENTADEDRTARFVVSYDGYDSVITVTQKARNATIEFEDPSVGIVLVDAFDSDGDGKLSYAEASRLTIDDAAKIDFSGLDIRSFDELRYFTEFWHLQIPSFAGSKIERIRFPYRLSGLGDGMFENCTELKEVELMCIGVGNRTFRGCTGLRSIEADVGGENAFDGCTALQTVVQQHPGVAKQAFLNCTSLNTFEFRLKYLSDGYIGYEAFKGCVNLPEISIPDVILEIRDRAFYDCSSLKSVYMESPEPPVLGNDVFVGTSPDLSIYVRPESVSRYKSAWPSLADRINGLSGEGQESDYISLPFHHISLKSWETEFAIDVGGRPEFDVEISTLNSSDILTCRREGRRCIFRLEENDTGVEYRCAAVFRNLDNGQREILYIAHMPMSAE